MPKKLGKTRAKGGRPTKAKQVEIRKKCEEEYFFFYKDFMKWENDHIFSLLNWYNKYYNTKKL